MTTLDTSRIFEAKNLDYDYPGNIPALRQLNLSIEPGELVALLGANGSGKSTLLKLMDGLIFPSGGQMLAFGKPLSEKALKDGQFVREFRRRWGWCFRTPTCSSSALPSGTKSPSGRCNWGFQRTKWCPGALRH